LRLRATFRYRGADWRAYIASEKELKKLWSPWATTDENMGGFIDAEAKSIFVLSGSSRTLERQRMFHELLHMANFEANLGLTHAQVYGLDKELHRLLRLLWETTN